MEARFSAVDSRFSQVTVSSASTDDNARNVSCQDVSNPSLLAPIASLAVRDEHPPARALYVPYSEGLGKFCKGPATVSTPTGVTSLPCLTFVEVIDRVRVYESSMGYVPDSHLISSFVVYSDEFNVVICGELLPDYVRLFRQRLSDPVDPVLGKFQGGDSVVRFLYCHLVSSRSSSQSSMGVAEAQRGVGLAPPGVCTFLPASLPPTVASSASLPLFPSHTPSSFPPSVPFSLPSVSFALPYTSFPTPLPATVPQVPLLFPAALPLPLAFLLHLFLFPSLRFYLLLLLRFHSLGSSFAFSFHFFWLSFPFFASLCFGGFFFFCSFLVSSYCSDLLGSSRLFVGPAPSISVPPAPPPPPCARFLPSPSFPVSLALPPPYVPLSSSVSTAPSSSCFVPLVSASLGAGIPSSDLARGYFDSSAGTSYVNFADPCSFHDGDDSSTKGEKDSPALGKSDSSQIFHKEVNLIVGSSFVQN